MEGRKVKNIVILLLLLVNGFLLVLVSSRQGEERRYEQSALTQAIQVLAQNNIAVSEEAVDDASGLFPQTVERSTDGEAAVVQALLGEEVAGENRGGGLYLYTGSCGEVSFRAGGELSAVLQDDARWYTDDPENHAAQLLRDMELEAERLSVEERGDGTAVVFRQLWKGVPVFSNQLTFLYSGGQLRSLTGVVVIGGQAAVEQGNVLTRPTALLRFLDDVLESRDVCTAVLSMKAGYRTAQDLSGTTRLTPYWLISTDTADYYMDAATGDLTRIAGE